MRKQAPTEEWTIAKDDADWARRVQPLPDPTPLQTLAAPRVGWHGVVLLLLLLSGGSWWWQLTQVGLQQTEAALNLTAHQPVSAVAHRPTLLVARASGDQSSLGGWLQQGQAVRKLRTAVQTAEPGASLDVVLDTVEVQGDQAAAKIITTAEHGRPAYRQTRFYLHMPTGWIRTDPDATLWGPERSLETTFFVFHFRQHDAAAVISVAPQLDALYTILRHNVGLALPPSAEKLVTEVRVTQLPGYTTPWLVVPDRLIVASPAVYWAPVELTDAELLAQALALPLLDQVLAQASERHQIRAAWQPLLEGLRLWQLWDLELPLAAWQEEVVQWIYVDLPAVEPGQATLLPNQYSELCAAHKLWLPSPVQLAIPLVCTDLDQDPWFFSSWGPRDRLLRLALLGVPVAGEYRNPTSRAALRQSPGQAVAVATLIEYAVATYGRERLPVLMAGLGQYESWNTLLPAVYGVSPAEFEAGWQVHLAEHNAVSLP